MIKILYLTPSLYNPGGMERILTEKINYFAESDDYEVSLITTEQNGRALFFAVNSKVNIVHFDLDFNSLFSTSLPVKYIKTKRKLNIYQAHLENFIKKNKIDICVSTGGKELEFLSNLNVSCKKICELHFSQSFREQFLRSNSQSVFWKWIGLNRTKMLIKQTLGLDKLIVLTKADLKVWKKTNTNVTQIYNFISADESTFDIALRPKKVVAIGRLDAQKGFDLLIDAWYVVNKRFPEWQLDIYGKGMWEDKLKSTIKQRNLDQVVTLCGVTKDIENVFRKSSFFVLSSRYEGFPMVLLESLFYGKPIVSFDCKTGPSEIIENNDCGILVPAENIEKLAEGIISMITDEAIRIKKGVAAKQKSKLFLKVNILRKWDDLFKNLINYENTNR